MNPSKTRQESVSGADLDNAIVVTIEAVKKGGVFAVATLTALATFFLLNLAGANRAAGADSHKGELKTGAQLWAENCMTCHEDRPRTSFSPAQSDAALRHMREEADLSPEEQEGILGFLKSGN
jgi:mono/diheme cytochrome c family protein